MASEIAFVGVGDLRGVGGCSVVEVKLVCSRDRSRCVGE